VAGDFASLIDDIERAALARGLQIKREQDRLEITQIQGASGHGIAAWSGETAALDRTAGDRWIVTVTSFSGSSEGHHDSQARTVGTFATPGEALSALKGSRPRARR
jgi:hypothetical protein